MSSNCPVDFASGGKDTRGGVTAQPRAFEPSHAPSVPVCCSKTYADWDDKTRFLQNNLGMVPLIAQKCLNEFYISHQIVQGLQYPIEEQEENTLRLGSADTENVNLQQGREQDSNARVGVAAISQAKSFHGSDHGSEEHCFICGIWEDSWRRPADILWLCRRCDAAICPACLEQYGYKVEGAQGQGERFCPTCRAESECGDSNYPSDDPDTDDTDEEGDSPAQVQIDNMLEILQARVKGLWDIIECNRSNPDSQLDVSPLRRMALETDNWIQIGFSNNGKTFRTPEQIHSRIQCVDEEVCKTFNVSSEVLEHRRAVARKD